MKHTPFLLCSALLAGLLTACGDGGRQVHYTLAPGYSARTDVELENDSRYVVLNKKDGFETLFRPLGGASVKPSDFDHKVVLGIIRDFHTSNGGIHITSIRLDDEKLLVNYNDTLLNDSDTSTKATMVILVPNKVKFSEADFYENGVMKASVTKTGIAEDL